MEIKLPQGTFRGSDEAGVLSFKGVPYAAAPVDELRFAPPQPPPVHDGVRDARSYGATVSTPPQRSAVIDRLLPDPVRAGENGLNLNIWTPGLSGRRPVLVWIHGGGFVTGAGSTSVFDGSAFARDGVVAVTINYRLAVEGFAALPGTVANRGLLDQVAALTWVRDNIEAFGGDPDQVTVAGQSAGAMAVLTLLAMPSAHGLMRRAISQSGDGHHVHAAETAALLVQELGAQLDLEPTPEALSKIPVEALHRAINDTIGRVTAGADQRFASFTRLAFQPVIDGDTLPLHPATAAAQGIGNEVDLMLGYNSQEYGLFAAPTGLFEVMTEEMLVATVTLLNVDAPAIIGAYRERLKTASPAQLFVEIQSDWFCRIATIRYAESRNAAGAPARVYEFSWQPSTYDGNVGACHTLEIPFVFDRLSDPWGREVRGADAPQSLADRMHAAWVRFIKGQTAEDEAPGLIKGQTTEWPVYDERRSVWRIDLDDALESDPGGWRREIWADLI